MNRTIPLPGAVKTASYRLRVDARLTEEPGGSLALEQSRYRLRLPGLEAGRRAVLLRMAETWLSDLQIAQLVAGLEGESRLLPTQLLVRRLLLHSWLERRVSIGARAVLDVVPRRIGAQSVPPQRRHRPGAVYRMSRFAVLRAEHGRMVAYSPLSTVGISCPRFRLAAVLARACAQEIGLGEVAEELEVDESAAGFLLDELLSARLLLPSEEAETETRAEPMALWSAEELWLHDRSRPERHAAPIGATDRFRGLLEADPGRTDTVDGRPSVALPTPPCAAQASGSLSTVMARRRSVRRHDDSRPVTLAQLGEFLHRVQRLELRDRDGVVTGVRPYPSAGGLGELEVYPLISQCEGLPGGLYHYDSVHHRLVLVAPPGTETERMLSFARGTATMPGPPQVLFVITARVGPLMRKYEGIPYTLALKDAGILTAWMYLVATDMGLAPCALGAGDAASFSDLAGMDTLAEPAIAEFALGSCPPEGRAPECASADE
ncbi:SagB family peptide dehydrogenase [Kitasatospora sp. RG8]|uniref:SagB family peptide dehydrogenase n=1 Tax=Kitasatospora sp. RG8 TaxID=2820815 RepID=UPI001ADFB8BA|nr:SagB family peptide dehydrogenase [Kitasatospora sp. RG8]MBP0448687.1 SagB family peptide dehydrogenase [Kitasatospora sp. RG8]